MAMEECFHCGEAIPPGTRYNLEIDGSTRALCCPGCLAVAESILQLGLGNYYNYRTKEAIRPEAAPARFDAALKAYDHPNLQRSFVESINQYENRVSLILEGVVCPACTWLIEKHLGAVRGISDVIVNYSNNQATVTWKKDAILLSQILNEISLIGYKAYPYAPGTEQALYIKEKRRLLQKIGIAGLLGMQVMMISIALYTGRWESELQIRQFFHWISLLLTTPVIAYSALPFYSGAIRDLKQKYTGMDLPVSLGIIFAYAGSLWSTITGKGDVYYDSVVMFVFFLLLGRYFEFVARKNNREYINKICQILPATATKMVLKGNAYEDITVPVTELQPGDRILIRPGETIPADGSMAEGLSSLNESLITGESLPVKKSPGDPLIGGSINIESPIQLIVEKTGNQTFVSQIIRLVEKAQTGKQRFNQLIHRVAGWFVIAVICIATVVAWYWLHTDSARWLPITLSVLVATCPCALALANPAAVTVAMTELLRSGVAVTNLDAIEKLARTTHFIFDKTGTLTEGRLVIDSIYTTENTDRSLCIELAAALEIHSEHPLARTLREEAGHSSRIVARDVINSPGEGISGFIAGKQYFVGTMEYIRTNSNPDIPLNIFRKLSDVQGPIMLLGDNQSIHCAFTFRDNVRKDAKPLIEYLKSLRKKVILLSGDKLASVENLAEMLGIEEYHYGLKPDDKVNLIKRIGTPDTLIAMTGDGINDAPVLASSDVAIAMGSGSDLARINADMILLNDQLDTLKNGVFISNKTLGIIRQNILWAILYNIIVLPSAASGFITPWMAAIGMSLSSLLVVGNAHRIKSLKTV